MKSESNMSDNFQCKSRQPRAHPEYFFGGGGADPEVIYALYLVLKIML
jgi:hypothetical protein